VHYTGSVGETFGDLVPTGVGIYRRMLSGGDGFKDGTSDVYLTVTHTPSIACKYVSAVFCSELRRVTRQGK